VRFFSKDISDLEQDKNVAVAKRIRSNTPGKIFLYIFLFFKVKHQSKKKKMTLPNIKKNLILILKLYVNFEICYLCKKADPLQNQP
jgi:hypothetical protein